MTVSQQTLDDAGRKRHLEALFADEPYLSPTMKARRMHEKMVDTRARDAAVAEWSAPPSLAIESPYSSAHLEEAAILRTERGPAGAARMSLQEARARLSGQGVPDPFGFTSADPISYFRTQVLSQWIQKVDRRENG